MVSTQADLSGVFGVTGGIGGILDAIESDQFEGDFTDWLMQDLKKKFTSNAIAINQSGAGGISHVFEWGPQDSRGVATGGGSAIPLFRLTKAGQGGRKMLSFHFVPSTKPVPLPDPAKYGFKASKLQFMRRHIFRYKAIVMESQTAVTIAPKNAKALFVPLASADKGYIMTRKPVTVNPGGNESSGGFSQFWTTWFETVAPQHVAEKTGLVEGIIGKTGQKVIRDAAGRFAGGTNVGVAYADAAKRRARLQMLTAARTQFANGEWEDDE
jgi:hypothetical protein